MSYLILQKISLLFLILFFLDIQAVFSITNYHQSNQNGMVLGQIQKQRLDEYEYAVKIVKYNNRQHSKELFNKGELIRTWKNKYTGKNNQVVEIYENDLLVKKEWLKNEIIIREFFYEQEQTVKKVFYEFSDQGLIEEVKTHDAGDNQISVKNYNYDERGRIRDIRKISIEEDQVDWFVFFYENGVIRKEVYKLKDGEYIFFYDRHGLEKKGEINYQDELFRVWENEYDKKGNILKKIENDYWKERKIISQYEKNLVNKRFIYHDDELKIKESYIYNEEDLLKRKLILEGLNKTEIYYEYNNDDEIEKERHLLNNSLYRIILYLENLKTEYIAINPSARYKKVYDVNDNLISKEIENLAITQ